MKIRIFIQIVLLLLPGLAAAQLTDLRLPISLDADSTDYDGKKSMLRFKGLRLSQAQAPLRWADILFPRQVPPRWRFVQ